MVTLCLSDKHIIYYTDGTESKLRSSLSTIHNVMIMQT